MRAWLCVLLACASAVSPRRRAVVVRALDPTRRGVLATGLAAPFFVVPNPAGAAPKAVKRLVDDADFFKPALDDRKYRLVELASGVRCLLVSDARAESSAAAMDVHVGHFSDPASLPGLAHFNEHMLFLGSAAFPGEDTWERWVGQAGGSSNAYTDAEDTCYFFDVPSNELKEALKRWGPFFASPLFEASATAREVEAIESEHAKNLQCEAVSESEKKKTASEDHRACRSDTFRLFQLQKSRAVKEHPFSKFGTGTRKTLRPPDGSGSPPRDALIDFFETYYVGDHMACCVFGSEKLDALEAMAATALEGIKPSKGGRNDLPGKQWFNVEPFPASTPDAFIVESLASQRALLLSWPLKYRDGEERLNSMKRKDEYYVSHILGHEGPESLLATLRRQGLASSLGAGLSEDVDDFRSLDVSVDLTQKGLKQWGDVSRLIVASLAALERTAANGEWPAYCLDEPREQSAIGWRWSESGGGSGVVTQLARKLQTVGWTDDAVKVLRVGAVPEGEPDLKEYLARLAAVVPQIYVLVPKEEVEAAKMGEKTPLGGAVGKYRDSQVEPIYSTKYLRVALDTAALCKPLAELPKLFPKPNPYALPSARVQPKRAPRRDDLAQARKPPTVVDQSAPGSAYSWQLWHKQDETFGQPRVNLLMLLRTPKPTMSASDLVHARLWRTLVVDALRDADLTTFGAYDASLAGLDWGLGAGARGVTLSFAGYVADQLASFVGVATKAMRDVDVLGYAALNGNLDRALDGIRRELQRDASTPPSTRAVNELALATERPKYAVSDQQAALDALSLKTFTAWLAEPVWDADRVDMLCSGNLDAAEARAVAKAALGGLGLAARGDGSYPAPHVALAPLKATGYTLLDVKAPNADETNYATLRTSGVFL